MATQKKVAPVPSKTKAMQKVEPDLSDMSTVPDYVEQEAQGQEEIGLKDVQLPRLMLLQAMSPQVTKGDPAYNENLRPGDVINSLTGEKYGDEAVTIVLYKYNKPRWVEFDEDGKNVIDRNVPADDPRTEWRTDPKTRENLPPIATMFYDYLCGVLPDMEPLMLSFKSSGVGDAKRLNGLIRSKKTGIWALRYRLTVVQKKNKQGTWYGFAVTQDGWVSPEEYEKGKRLYELFKEKAVDFNEAPAEEAVPEGEM